MSSCLLDYLAAHNKELPPIGGEYPFSEFDAAVFSWLVYFPLVYVPEAQTGGGDESIALKDYCEMTLSACRNPRSTPPPPSFKNGNDSFTFEKYSMDEYKKELIFLEHIKDSPRYRDVRLERSRAVNDSLDSNRSPLDCAQFGAVTFVILPYKDGDEKIRVITFRGTNMTFVGWRDNLYFALDNYTPRVKILAVDYVSGVIEQCPDSRFVITGHSKGGHLAVYGFYMFVYNKWYERRSEIHFDTKGHRERIMASFYKMKGGKSVLNFDGPGIKESEKKSLRDSRRMIIHSKNMKKWLLCTLPLQQFFPFCWEETTMRRFLMFRVMNSVFTNIHSVLGL